MLFANVLKVAATSTKINIARSNVDKKAWKQFHLLDDIVDSNMIISLAESDSSNWVRSDFGVTVQQDNDDLHHIIEGMKKLNINEDINVNFVDHRKDHDLVMMDIDTNMDEKQVDNMSIDEDIVMDHNDEDLSMEQEDDDDDEDEDDMSIDMLKEQVDVKDTDEDIIMDHNDDDLTSEHDDDEDDDDTDMDMDIDMGHDQDMKHYDQDLEHYDQHNQGHLIQLRRSARLAAAAYGKESSPPLILGSVFVNSVRRSTRLMRMVH